GIDIVVRYASNGRRGFVGDQGRIRQILLNLVSNAVKFTNRGHVLISVVVEQPDGMPRVNVGVQDTGCGITADQLERVFDKFTQADTSSTRSHGGTGLGLAISRRLAEMMGGTLTAESVAGQGSTFRLSVPLPVADETHEKQATGIELRDVRVLILDDN